LIGTILRSRYELTGLIADGPLFASYSARDRIGGRDVCLRLVKPPFSSEAEFVTALGKAVTKYSAVHQTGIESLLELDQDDGMAFIVSDLTRGPTLADRIRKLAPFSIPVSVATGISICQALDAVHRLGFVHGDIQGANMIVMADGEVRLQLTGIWEAYSASPTAGAIVVPGMSPYLAPEVSAGGMPTPQSDVYAVGILLFELLSGRRPYIADGTVAMALRHANTPTPNIRSINPSVPVVLDEIVKKAMSKNPADRYLNAGELLSDLRILQDALRFGRALSWPLRGASGAVNHTAAVQPQPVAPRMGAVREKIDERDARAERDVPVWMIVAFTFLCGVVLAIVIGWMYFNLNKPKLVQVPNIRGSSSSEAKAALEAIHLKMRVVAHEPSERVEMDRVIDVDPPPNTEMPQGGSVKVTLSAGSRLVAVPDLSKNTVDGAKTILGNLNLEMDPTVGKAYAAGASADEIVKQVPAANSKVERGSQVKVFIDDPSLAPPPPAPAQNAAPPGQTTNPANPSNPANSGASGNAPTDNSGNNVTATPGDGNNIFSLKLQKKGHGEMRDVRVDVQDDEGVRTVFDQPEAMDNEELDIDTSSSSKTIKFMVYYGHQLVLTKTGTLDSKDPE
jgi:serine/threonine-protein kinase